MLFRSLIRMDKQIANLNACDASTDHIVVSIRRGIDHPLPTDREKKKAMKEYGYPYTHGNVSRHINANDWACMTRAAVQEMLRRAGMR